MRVLSFIRQRSFARYVAFDLAEAARTLGWSVLWLDIEGRLYACADAPPSERSVVVSRVLSEIEQFDPQLVFSYGLEYLARVFESATPGTNQRFDELLRRPAAYFLFDFGFPFDRPLLTETRPLVAALQSPGAFVYCWDREAMERLGEFGILKSCHFPMAFNQRMFYREQSGVGSGEEIPILFVGGPDDNRNRCLEPLAERGLNIYGYDASGWTARLQRCHRGGLYERPELRRVYNRARICVNATREHGQSSLNMRVYEAMACGTLMLTDDKADARELFDDGKELLIYRGARDLVEKVDACLADNETRTRIADAGCQRIHAEHTYDIRLKAVAPLLAQQFTEYRLFSNLEAYASADPVKALAFVEYLRGEKLVTQNLDSLACRTAELHAARGDVARARSELDAARRLNPASLAASELAEALRRRGPGVA